MSLFSHSTVSPVRIGPGGAEIAIAPIVICTFFGALAEADSAPASARTSAQGTIHFRVTRALTASLHFRSGLFGVQLVALEQLQAGLQQRLELRMGR